MVYALSFYDSEAVSYTDLRIDSVCTSRKGLGGNSSIYTRMNEFTCNSVCQTSSTLRKYYNSNYKG